MPTNTTTNHIRCRPRRTTNAHRPGGGWRNGAEATLCGAESTINDLLWADTRWPKQRTHVSCPACVDIRAEQGASRAVSR